MSGAYKYRPQYTQNQLGPGEGENNDVPTEETMKYQIYLEGKPVSPEPSTYYPSRRDAENHIKRMQAESLTWYKLGALEVRESGK